MELSLTLQRQRQILFTILKKFSRILRGLLSVSLLRRPSHIPKRTPQSLTKVSYKTNGLLSYTIHSNHPLPPGTFNPLTHPKNYEQLRTIPFVRWSNASPRSSVATHCSGRCYDLHLNAYCVCETVRTVSYIIIINDISLLWIRWNHYVRLNRVASSTLDKMHYLGWGGGCAY